MKVTIVGAGIFGATCARELVDRGHEVTVIDRRQHIGGNCYTKKWNGVNVHMYGAHIFHTDSEWVWEYVNKFSDFHPYVHKVWARVGGAMYPMPFNRLAYQMVFGDVWVDVHDSEKMGVLTDMFVKGYSEKQWGVPFDKIPKEALARIAPRDTWSNDYFYGEYQGIPVGGYTQMISRMLSGATVELDRNYTMDDLDGTTTIYTGCIDELFGRSCGPLEYRSLEFRHVPVPLCDNHQGTAVVNFPEKHIGWTRIIEHKHFEFNTCRGTVVTYEYPLAEGESYYPVNTDKNQKKMEKYLELAHGVKGLHIGGRLGLYRYLDMDDAIKEAWALVNTICHT